MRLLITIVLQGIFVLELFAQTLKDTISISTVDVVASVRITERGVNKTVIDSLILAERLTSSVSDILAKHSLIFIRSYGQGLLATASFRGTAASHTQVLWNGINVNSPMLGVADLSILPVFFADDISLYYGSSSLVKSGGALGGLINIENKPDWNNKLKVSLVQGLGSFSNNQTYAFIAFGNSRFQSKTRLFRESSINDFEFKNMESGSFEYMKQKNADFQKYGLMQEFYSRIGYNNLFSAKVWCTITNRNLPTLTTNESIQAESKEYQNDNSVNIVVDYKRITKTGSILITGGGTSTNMLYFSGYEDGNKKAYVRDSSLNKTAQYFGKVNYLVNIAENIGFQTGIDFNYSSISNINTIKMIEDTSVSYCANRTEWSGFARLSLQISNRWNCFLIAKQVISDSILIPVMPSFTVEYNALKAKRLVFRTNVARNYHLPSLNDLYYPSGNPLLKPEKGYSADFNVQFNHNYSFLKIDTKLSFFASIIDNWIVWKPSEKINTWTAENIKTVFSRGFEYYIGLSGNIARWSYHAKANYSYTRASNKDTSSINNSKDNSYGKQLIYTPFHVYNLLINIEHKKYYCNYSINYTGNRYASSDNNVNSLKPRYLLNDVEIGKNIAVNNFNFDVQLRINNIFDIQYQPFFGRAMPGRNYGLLVRLNFSK